MADSSYNKDMRRYLCLRICLLVLGLTFSLGQQALAQAFDLAGPKVDVHIKRGQLTLPIGEVPSLLPDDRIWVHADLPESQSARYVLVVAFLRGATNPPPANWFTRVETWTRAAHEEGVFVTVPQEAQQALLFLAPETGGDFTTLRNAVRGRPGMFVRATQDLQAASWDRMRLDAYLDEVKVTSQTDPKSLKERAEVTARSLGIKVNQDCFDKPPEQQAPCLSQHTEGLVMDDANTQSRVAQIANGSTADLMNQLSYSTMGGAGAYSPYVGAIVDTVRILSSVHTAHYQYIPALALPTKDTLNLKLSVPPSFRDPKSVVVVALPPIGPARMPPLHPVNPSDEFCAQRPGLALPAEGAPLVLATQMAYDLKLHFETAKGPIDLPLRAEPAEGGLVLEHVPSQLPPGDLTGVVRGKWGFDDWEGPRYHLHSAQPGDWTVPPSDQSALIVGRMDTLHLHGESTVCVDKVEQSTAGGNSLPLTWKSPKPEMLEVAVPLKDTAPGPVTIQVSQFGLSRPDAISLQAYAEAASLSHLSLSAGDPEAVLTGTRLDEVARASLDGITWLPDGLSRVDESDHLAMKADSSTASLEPGKQYFARVQLRDSRELKTPVNVTPPHPEVILLSKGAQDQTADAPSPVQLGSADDLPVDRRLVFFLKSQTPAYFPRNEKIEVAALDGSFHTVLSLADGSLMLEDTKTALGVVEPLARFGASAFGPIKVRAISADGVSGSWLPLGTLVRLPGFKELRCPRALAKPCVLTGTNLFLAASIAATQQFDNPDDVPQDFTGVQLSVPHPTNGMLYFKLRDDPATVQTLSLPVLPISPASAKAANTQPGPSAPAPAAESQAPPTGPPAAKTTAQPAATNGPGTPTTKTP